MTDEEVGELSINQKEINTQCFRVSEWKDCNHEEIMENIEVIFNYNQTKGYISDILRKDRSIELCDIKQEVLLHLMRSNTVFKTRTGYCRAIQSFLIDMLTRSNKQNEILFPKEQFDFIEDEKEKDICYRFLNRINSEPNSCKYERLRIIEKNFYKVAHHIEREDYRRVLRILNKEEPSEIKINYFKKQKLYALLFADAMIEKKLKEGVHESI